MDTNLISQFCAVMESGTVARAAEELHITPGALSRALKRLEEELEVTLFISSGRNIIPTHEAKSFYIMGKEILTKIAATKAKLKESENNNLAVRIATFEVFSTHFLAEFLAQENLETHFFIQEKTPGLIETAILEQTADIGLTYIPFLHPELDHLPLGEFEIGVFHHAHAASDLAFAVPLTELGENITRTHSLDGWPQEISRKVKYQFEMLETAIDLASRGLCKICCPKFIVAIENKRLLPEFRLELDPSLESIKFPKMKVYLVKRKSSLESKEMKKLGKFMRKTLNNT